MVNCRGATEVKRRFTAGLKTAGQRLICLGKDEDENEDENCLGFRV